MAYETGTAADYRDLLLKIKTFISTNATLVGLGQEWAIHEFEQGTAIRHVTNYGDGSMKNAFDRDGSTYWSTVNYGYVSIEFPSPVAISYFNITVATGAGYAPEAFDLQYSDDGVNWDTAASYTGLTWPTFPLTQVFTTDVLVSETHAYWRLDITDGPSGGIRLAEIALYEFGDTGYTTDLAAEDILIAEGPGLSGTEEIYVGFKTYSDANSDYYNIAFNAFTGYVPGHDFSAQPGRHTNNHMMPSWNHPMLYYIRADGQGITVLAKIETVYVMLHAGKFFPYATPVQYPLPLVLCGMYASEATLRYSSSSLEVMLRTSVSIRFVDGLWKSVEAYPFENHVNGSGDYSTLTYPYTAHSYNWRDMGGTYPTIPIVLSDSDGVYGELSGLYFISGFDNAVENTVTLGGDTHVIWRNLEATGFADYYSLELT